MLRARVVASRVWERTRVRLMASACRSKRTSIRKTHAPAHATAWVPACDDCVASAERGPICGLNSGPLSVARKQGRQDGEETREAERERPP